ncbi:MAG: flagellar biosynthesis protein FlhF, partial [Pseudomonadota bacterium]
KILAFIGPTGVGKTTTLAKIAAQFSADPHIKVKIVTMDTYRIAAVEQLKIYAKIMGLPVAVVSNKQELARELEAQDDTNLMLIDTAGRNYRDNEQIAELSTWLRSYKTIEAHLLLSATTSEEVLASTIQCFQKARVDRIIITKVDESIRQGHLYNLVVSSKIPVSYVTTGQRVPEDIMPATARNLSGIFLNGFAN